MFTISRECYEFNGLVNKAISTTSVDTNQPIYKEKQNQLLEMKIVDVV